MCVTLVVYQESLHDARSTKYEIILVVYLMTVMQKKV
jgi:hypothetical protein